MSLLSDFFLAPPEALANGLPIGGPASGFRTLAGKRVDPVKLLTLQRLLDDGSVVARFQASVDLFLYGGDDRPFVLSVPERMSQALAGASPQRIAELAAEWAATEEWVLDGGTPESLRPWLQEIAALARQPGPIGKNLFLWISE